MPRRMGSDHQPRTYDRILAEHVRTHRQLALVSGPRQVGKTTACQRARSGARYLTWDDQDDRRLLSRGPKAIAADIGLADLAAEPTVLVIDEIHKYRRWKTLLKGLFDGYADRLRVLVTGSSRLDVYRRGGDSLMGRYFLYRMHPLTLGELRDPTPPAQELRPPRRPRKDHLATLLQHGGFPEPFLRADQRFTNRWRGLRRQQLLREDVRDTTRIQEIGQLEILARLLDERAGHQLVYANLARDVNIAVDTARRWVDTLCGLHHGFLVRPWFKNVSKALRKEPKWYPRDWSEAEDQGARAEAFIAGHLLKAVETWTDLGLGSYELRYLRDKEKREVDFLVVRGRKPWFLVEVKRSDGALSPALAHFQRQTQAPHAFQVVLERDFVPADPFDRRDPCVVPASTLLSQLP